MKKIITLLAVVFCLNGWGQCSLTTSANTFICAGQTTTLTATALGGNGVYTYSWTPVGGNAPSIAVTPSATTVYTVTATTGTCTATNTISVTVSSTPSIFIAAHGSYCPGDVVPAPTISTNPSNGVSLNWSVTNANVGMPASGTGIPAAFTSPANSSQVDLIGIVSYAPSLGSCIGNIVNDTIIIKPTPIMQAISNQYYCSASNTNPINFATLPPSAVSVYMWTYYNGGIPMNGTTNIFPSLLTSNNGSMLQIDSVVVTPNLNGCPGPSSSFIIGVYPNPIAKFTYLSSFHYCSGQSIDFIDQSLPNSGQIMVNQWAWDFNNDGVTDSNAENPSFSIPTSGSNTVNLMVYTNSTPSCYSMVSELLFITPLPTASFSLQKDTIAVSTWNAYPNYGAGILSTTWYWGDGDSTLGFYPSHTYAQAGSYNICLKSISDSGCVSTICQNDSIYRLVNSTTSGNMVHVNVINTAVGISQISGLNSNISIYPNPSSGLFNLSISQFDKRKISSIEVYNLIGECVHSQLATSANCQIDLSNLPNGIYNVSIISKQGVVNKKLVITK